MRKTLIKGTYTLVGALLFVWVWYIAFLDVKLDRRETGSLKNEMVLFALLVGAALAVFWLVLKWWQFPWLNPINRLQNLLGWKTYWAGITLIVISVTIFFGYSEYGPVSTYPSIRWITFFGVIALVACLIPWMDKQTFPWPEYLAGIVLVGAVLSFGASLQKASDYPFQFTWSEGNRFWDYSILYGRRLYLYPSDQPFFAFIDPGRQSLWGLPFLVMNPTIQQMRLWSILVFSVPYALLGWMIFRPGQEKHTAQWFFLGLWSFLFLNQGPIYTPLILSAILVIGGRRLPFWLNLILVLMAGYYAQISRYTWMFAPAMWAVVVTFVEVNPLKPIRSELDRWLRAVAVGAAGLAGGFLLPRFLPWLLSYLQKAQTGQSTSIDTGLAQSITRQPLLWERLLPNPTYPLGILPALIMATAPLLALVIYWLFFNPRAGNRPVHFNQWQKLAVTGALIVFLAVGLVASVKIGGGNNLHNMDMFLVGLLITAGLIWEAGGVRWLEKGSTRPAWVTILILVMVLYPTAQVIQETEPRNYPDQVMVAQGLKNVRSKVAAAQACGEVLFIDQRQLLTFGYVNNVTLVPDYEKKLMMDKAMAEDKTYFEPFYNDLANQRFALIIVEPLHEAYQGDVYQFGNENDAWVKWISRPVLKKYHRIDTMEDLGVQFLVPNGKKCAGLP